MLCLAAIPITPYGTELAMYPFKVASKYPLAISHVMEWGVMPFNLTGGKVFLALVLGFFLAQVVFRFEWNLPETLLFLGGVGMACLHVRFLMLFVPFFAPLFATTVVRWFPAYNKDTDKYLINFALMAAIAIAVTHYFPSRVDIEKSVADKFPVHALEYLREHPVPGPMFNSYRFGGYLIFSGYKTFIDGRGEMFEEVGVFRDYIHITLLMPGALKVLDRYGIRACLVDRDDSISTFLEALPNWEKAYSDNVSVLYVRKDAGEPAAFSGAGTPEGSAGRASGRAALTEGADSRAPAQR
jgi:hypothetical protein